MRRFAFIAILMASFAVTTLAQDHNVKDRLRFSLSTDQLPSFKSYSSFNNREDRLQTTYGVFKYLEVGGFVGHTSLYNSLKSDLGNSTWTSSRVKTHGISYGATANFHPLPLLFDTKGLKLDLYLSGKVGAMTYPASDEYMVNGTYLFVQTHVGLAYYFTKRWGVFGEYGYNFYRNDYRFVTYRYGLTFKF